MRLWQKVFIGTFILFELVFNTANLYFVEYNFNQSLNSEIERGLSEQYFISTGLQTNGTILKERLGNSETATKDFLTATAQNYTQHSNKEAYLEIYDSNNKIIYSSFDLDFNGQREELNTPLSDLRKYIIRDIGKQSFLFVTNSISMIGDTYKITYIRDISNIYGDRVKQQSFLIKMNVAVTLCLAIGLYLLLWYLTSSIRDLTKSAQSIANGNYSERVDIGSKDEVGILGQSFNQMAAAIEDKVSELNNNALAKQHFIECLTHELKTPLTSIIGYADFLRSTKYDEENSIKGLSHIYSEGKHLESLSLKLMELILLEKQEIEMKSEDIRLLCLKAAEALKTRLDEKNISLEIDVPSLKAVVEKDLFLALLTNLLDNAIKSSSIESSICLKGYTDDQDQLVLEVVDKGIGISEKDIASVFEPFFMADKSRSRLNNGAGLGLSICANIVKLHKGKIDIVSRLNEGTTVRMLFPHFTTI